ncbi:Eco57I restriction-modification methylase domain-containing protein [Anaerovibrio slackiae]|uniref:Eco57I restriction-modification methylase domain-containing protein n=1 Tax=Anaerovibrio slackiae TaxID=2652309 RepID=UPI0038657243
MITAAEKKIQYILQNSYSTENYVLLVQELFDNIKLVAPNKFNKECTNFSYHIEGSSHVGYYTAPDNKKLIIASVKLNRDAYVKNSRSTQRSYAKVLIENGNCDAALIAFYTEGEPRWRLSFVRLDYELKVDNGKVKMVENMTPAKRYSFLVGKDEPCHTAVERFRHFVADENYHPTLDELEEAFSVEAVTKEFFNLYCEKFKQLLGHLEDNPDFVEEAKYHNFTAAQFAKKLLGQIVFLYFLQKKGWLGVNTWPDVMNEKAYKKAFFKEGKKSRDLLPLLYTKVGDDKYKLNAAGFKKLNQDDETVLANCVIGKPWGSGPKDFMRILFKVAVEKKANFFDDYLEPLFYNALNVNRGEQSYDPDLHCRIPFLSGGLFEPIDGYDWKNNNFAIPNEVFSNREGDNHRTGDGILDIFDRYNFTMSEDEPLEREVAVDPEMLGKVFENLLEVKDRKAKGAFYTPREIVHYMCQESLINYLQAKVQVNEQAIRDFILYGDFMKDEDTIKEKRQGNGEMLISPELFKVDSDGKIVVNKLFEIDKALQEIRVADPAVGSGAFPLGMLNEIVRARQNISAYLRIGMTANQARIMYSLERSPYTLKHETIRNCIFAADIEPSAVDIARLRLWLALVIDDNVNPNAHDELDGHVNPLPLPNLECNIVCGNSLLDEFEGVPLINKSELIGTATKGQTNFGMSVFEPVLKKLIATQDELFKCDDTRKKQSLLETITSLKDELILNQFTENGASTEVIEKYHQSKELASKPYVLWQIDFARVFREKGGFDVVIGNPPYVGEARHKEIFREIAVTRFGSQFYNGKMDLFYFFYHKGLDIGKIGAFCSYITTNYLLDTYGASKLRQDFYNRTNIVKMINFNELKIFESALGQHNMICFLQKVSMPNLDFMTKCSITKRKGFATADILNKITLGKDVNTDYFKLKKSSLFTEDGLIVLHPLDQVLDKIRSKSNFKFSKNDVDNGIDILQDFVTEKHVKINPSYVKGDGVFALHESEVNNMKLNKYEVDVLKPYFTSKQIGRYCVVEENVDDYIIYMDKAACLKIQDMPNLKEHFDKYAEIITSDNKPYGLHRARSKASFEGEKILSLRMTKYPSFAYASGDTFVTRAYMVIKPQKKINLLYLIGFLNSKICYYWLYYNGKRKGKQLQIDKAQILDIPIFMPDAQCIETITKYVEKAIHYEKSQDSLFNETVDKINHELYKCYELDESEIQKIELLYQELLVK